MAPYHLQDKICTPSMAVAPNWLSALPHLHPTLQPGQTTCFYRPRRTRLYILWLLSGADSHSATSAPFRFPPPRGGYMTHQARQETPSPWPKWLVQVRVCHLSRANHNLPLKLSCFWGHGARSIWDWSCWHPAVYHRENVYLWQEREGDKERR